ncbi:MAG: hypothetical protein H6621_04340 [Halobacteriovoraceae bacterium]|nr:hypothetical protein [Halobacteriovoraceae bacterium]
MTAIYLGPKDKQLQQKPSSGKILKNAPEGEQKIQQGELSKGKQKIAERVQLSEQSKELAKKLQQAEPKEVASASLEVDTPQSDGELPPDVGLSELKNASSVVDWDEQKVEDAKKSLKVDLEKIKNLVKKPSVIFIKGLELFSSGGYDGIEDIAENTDYSKIFSWRDTSDIIDHIKSIDPQYPVILVGHSLGADTAVEVANQLNKLEDGFRTVDLLVTIDSFGANNDLIPQNVRKNLNFFGDGKSFFNDGPNAALNQTLTTVVNNLRHEDHTDIDDSSEVQRTIVNEIKNTLFKI